MDGFWTGEVNAKAVNAVKAARRGKVGRFSGFAETAKGTRKYWDVVVSPILDPHGAPRQILSVSRDATERMVSEGTKRQGEERYRALIEATATTVWHANPEGGLIFVGEQGDKVSGQSVDGILEWGWLTALHPDDRDRTAEIWRKALKNKTLYSAEFRILATDGEYRWFAANAVPIFETNGNVREWVGINTDITNRKRTELNLAFLSEISHDLVQLSAPHEIMRVMTEKIGNYFRVSACVFAEVDTVLNTATVEHAWRQDENIADLTGRYELSEFVSDEYRRTLAEGQPVIINDAARETVTTESAESFRQLNIASFINTPFVDEGHLKIVLGIYHREPYRWRTDEIELLKELMTRIWTRIKNVRAEVALRRSEEKYRTLFDSIDEGFCIIEMIYDDAGKPIDWLFVESNPAFERNNSIKDVTGKRITEMVPDIEPKWFEIYGRVASTGEPSRFSERSEALGVWFDVYAFRVGAPDQHRLAVLFNDVTARKRAEQEREESHRQLEIERARLAYIFEKAPAFVAVLRGATHLFEVTNPAYQQLIGHRNVSGKTVREALPDVSEQGFFELLDGVYQTGEPFIGRELAIELQRVPDGVPEKRFLDFVYQPIFGADNQVSGIFVHGVDITVQVEARQQAENANRLKDEFLAMLSHELRTPLNTILGWSQAIQRQNLNESNLRKAIDIIERSARAQNQLIVDLLDVSRIITGKLRLDVRAVDLPNVITAAVDSARPAAEAKNIQLQLLIDPQAGPISGDPDRLQQIVWNLLSNAIKFTPKDGRVQVRLERINSHVEIVVSDTGKGIDPEFLPHVFDRFRQSDGSMTRRHGGLGLGLAIVRQLVELHGGTVIVESAGEDQGATFTISLPLLPIRRESVSETLRSHTSAARSAEVIHDAPAELAGYRILLVDDEANTRELLTHVLSLAGAEVTTVGSAPEALETVQGKHFDLIISDVGMPDEDGFSLIRKIRQLPREQGGTTPAIALTAYARAADRIQALRSGFQLHIAKPVDHLELIASIGSLIKQ